ncbi:MAG: efflux transporter, family, subunit [Chlorobi bacterium]|jgi:RND family efflux transporter MFP subunit|nr:efflux transporter, family, subunit [Chlorobiota bacterium]
MKKVLAVIITIVIVGTMVFILRNNKAKSNEKSKVPPPKAFAVTVAPITVETVSDDLSLVGTIVANREVSVTSETQGRVRAVGPRVGDHVSAGATIARVDDELKSAAVANAQINYDKAKTDLDRYKLLQSESQGGVADIQVQNMYQAMKGAETQLTIARRQLRDTRITSPISGVVTARPIEIGTSLAPGTPVITIVDISQLKVKVNVPEEDVFKLKDGDRVEISTDVYPGVTFNARVTMIGAKADEAHTYPVEVTLSNTSEHPLRAGMFGRVHFISIPSHSAQFLPREALLGSIKNAQVYVVENGVAKVRNIEVGQEVGTKIEVLKGLLQGDKVVVSGQNNIRDGAQVTVTNQNP